MSRVAVVARSPWVPHTPQAISVVSGVDYGFILGQPSQVELAIPLSDPNAADDYDIGRIISIERPDKLLPWWGYITDSDEPGGDPYAYVTATDLLSAILEVGRTAKTWLPMNTSSGTLIRRVLAEAALRMEPPLQIEVPLTIGPAQTYQSAAESLLDFMDTMSETADWEYALRPPVAHGRPVGIEWTRRLGLDHRHELVFEEGWHFTDLTFTRSVKGYLKTGLAIGGTGTVRSRPAVAVSPNRRGEAAITGQGLIGTDLSHDSPVKAGTRTLVEPQVTGEQALTRAAQRLHDSPETPREALTFTCWEGDNADGVASIDVGLLELGGLYGVRFTARGRQTIRDIRITALAFRGNESIEIVAEVLPADAYR